MLRGQTTTTSSIGAEAALRDELVNDPARKNSASPAPGKSREFDHHLNPEEWGMSPLPRWGGEFEPKVSS